jgi:flagellar P-ring protein precursor FlgI
MNEGPGIMQHPKQLFPIRRGKLLVLAVAFLLWAQMVSAVRIKDVTHIEGVRENQLIGYGLVVGLDGTGDGSSTEFTVRSLVAYLRRQGVTILPGLVKVKNAAAVVVTADLPAFSRTGSRLDVAVSSIGDAENLQGGTLLMTELKGADGQVYAVAQGAVSIGGFEAGQGGSSVQKNHPTAGKVPGGALIEREPPTSLAGRTSLNFLLENPDFTTAERIAEVINQKYPGIAQASDNTGVAVKVPTASSKDLATFIADLERMPVHPDQRARIVIDERTGTIVMGEEVRISSLAIAHGSLVVKITKTNDVSQPTEFSQGRTARVSQNSVKSEEEDAKLMVVPEGVSLGEVVQSLNAIGVTPRDLIAILQTMRTSGALQAELVIK